MQPRFARNLVVGPAAARFWRLATLLLAVVVGYLALTPVPPPEFTTGWDKLNHGLAFTALAWSGCLGMTDPRRRMPLLCLLLGFGAAIELLQLGVPGRSSEWADLLADGIGLGVGTLLAWRRCVAPVRSCFVARRKVRRAGPKRSDQAARKRCAASSGAPPRRCGETYS